MLDGGSGRFAAADRIGHMPAPQSTPELLQGFDTVTQITALAHLLRSQPSPRSALGHQCIRDALRLTLWRATGFTGAWLAPPGCCP